MTRPCPHRGTALLAGVLLAGCLQPHFPPEPGPDPDVAPVPGPISVLIVEETDDRVRPEMRPYLGVLNSVKVREYLNAHCRKVAGQPQWLIVDDDADLTHADPYWRDALALPRASVPWIAISNGTRGTSGPLPTTEEETLALLRKWGGP